MTQKRKCSDVGIGMPTLRSRLLGRELRRIRLRAGYQGNHMARRLGWLEYKVSKLENGKRLFSDLDVVNYLARAQATPEEVDEMMGIQRSIRDTFYMERHRPGYHDQPRSIGLLEQDDMSDSITSYDARSVPDLLQTEDYIRATLMGFGLSGDDLEEVVKMRLSRQRHAERFLRGSTFFVHERALSVKTQGRNLMRAQLAHLAIMAAASQCEVRVVPDTDTDADVPVNFRIYCNGRHWVVVAVEIPTATFFFSGDDDFAAYREVLAAIKKTALGAEESISRINALADQFCEDT